MLPGESRRKSRHHSYRGNLTLINLFEAKLLCSHVMSPSVKTMGCRKIKSKLLVVYLYIYLQVDHYFKQWVRLYGNKRCLSTSALAFSLGHADHYWFRNADLSHVSTKIFKSNKIKNTKDKAPITFRIQCLGCCVFQNVQMMYFLKPKKKDHVEFETF